jgi:fructokinase
MGTTTPDETLDRAVAFLAAHHAHTPLAALGIASFGPLDLDVDSPTFGFITGTPKRGWARTDVMGPFRRALAIPAGLDTDVNAAALAEYRWGAGQSCDSLVYVTVGTGIGGGAIVDGHPLHGLVHPEMGHVRVPHDQASDPFGGICPYHGDCLEGLASGPALHERWGTPPERLASDHPAWELEAIYLAHGLATIVSILSPRRIVIGGGLMSAPRLLTRVRVKLVEVLGGYIRASAILEDVERYVVPPALGARAGVLGAIALALDTVPSDAA